MSLEDWKLAYRKLDPDTRRELARWIVEQELGGTASLPQRPARPPQPAWLRHSKLILIIAGLTTIIGGLVWTGMRHIQEKEAAQARMTQAERAAEEARRPRSPRNLNALRQRLGQEVTVTGVPELAEVGMLYFARDKKSGLRLNLMPTGLVLIQSTELEAIVREGKEITATGVVEELPGGQLEMKIHGLGQLRRRDQP